ncbi:helix-turn-helix domain-containing protein [Euryarchaeota archaeon]|nr:helix-turn-helix domain-containing protein [Euryarchaeota archaeon]MDC0962906.1 helix-turn-helix domain-containing protein [Euryarchaeota archaeon]
MRKVVLKWKTNSLRGSKEISEILQICERMEILGHLSINEEGVTQLAEIKLKEGKNIEELDNLDNFKVVTVHEENEDGVLVSLFCTHPLAITAIELSNIHIQPPYGISEKNGMEMRISGLSNSIRRFISLIRIVLPPDNISVQSFQRENNDNIWETILTERQVQVLSHAIRKGFYSMDRNVTLKQLADEMEMARSTYGEHIRRAEVEIMNKIFNDLN